jgi:ABC-type uncharacterized transport system ATPase subunit
LRSRGQLEQNRGPGAEGTNSGRLDNPSAMIKTQNLSKQYDGLLAVDDLTFSVEPGEVLGFLGPNGAG